MLPQPNSTAGPRPLRATLDCTPLLGARTGIGRFVEHLLAGLATRTGEVSVTATAFTGRGLAQLGATVPSGVRVRGVPLPARLLRAAWSRGDLPRAEWLVGRSEVFHATNYVLPPLGRAAGVLSIHDLSFEVTPHTVHSDSLAYRFLVPRGLRRAAIVCALTDATADQIAEHYNFPRERIVRTPLGVDPAWFAAQPPAQEVRDALGLPERYLLFVGTREPRKGLPTLLSAHARLRARDRGTPPLVLIGARGWQLDELARPGVHVLPYVEQRLLPDVVAGAAVLVMPSVYEGFGLPVLEGMAAGTPVVISDVPAMLEVAGGHATVFPVGDADALADALTVGITEPGAGLEAARSYASSWTWARCVDAVLDAYRMALT